jgi:hypothetical protein
VTQHDDFSYRLTASLNQGIQGLEASTARQLAQFRQQSLSSRSSSSHAGAVLALLHRPGFLAPLLALIMLFSGWWLMQGQQASSSVETDILLLTGDLPPNAYADKTFSQWLNTRASF